MEEFVNDAVKKAKEVVDHFTADDKDANNK
jgi:hypothetical protein